MDVNEKLIAVASIAASAAANINEMLKTKTKGEIGLTIATEMHLMAKTIGLDATATIDSVGERFASLYLMEKELTKKTPENVV